MRTLENPKLLPVTHCPFCDREFSEEQRTLIAERLEERNENGDYVFPEFRVICSVCHGEIKLIRRSDYFEDESVPPV